MKRAERYAEDVAIMLYPLVALAAILVLMLLAAVFPLIVLGAILVLVLVAMLIGKVL